MNVLSMLHRSSWPLTSKIHNLLEIRCLLPKTFQVPTHISQADRSFHLERRKAHFKGLLPVLMKELDLELCQAHRFMRSCTQKILHKYSLRHRLRNLREMGFTNEDIKSELSVLLFPPEEIVARKEILEECGVKEVTTRLLAHYEVLSNLRISLLKASGLIPQEINVPENILSYSGADIPPPHFHFFQKARHLSATTIADSLALTDLHNYTVSYYMAWYLKSPDCLKRKKLFKFKSLQHVNKALVALRALKVPETQLAKNPCLTHCDTEKLDDLLRSYPKIAGKDMKEIIQQHPNVAVCSCSDIKAVLQCLKEYGISEAAIAAHPAILAVKVDLLCQRLNFLKSSPDLWALRYSDRILRLLYRKDLILKLEYLKSLPEKVVPTVSLIGKSTCTFDRALQRGSSQIHVKEFLEFLSKEFHTNKAVVKAIISRHPLWRLGLASEMFATLTYLRSRGFSDPDILENAAILLYPRSYVQGVYEESIAAALSTRKSTSASSKINLALCLYYIEKSHGFTGAGIRGSEVTEGGQIQTQLTTL